MNNEQPVAWIDKITGKPKMIGYIFADYDIPLYLHPANTCKHGVDDGACKECYQEATHPIKDLTDDEIVAIALEKGLIVEEQLTEDYAHDYVAETVDFARAILRKAQEK